MREDLALLPDDAPALFPVFLKLANRHCLAVGGGKVAEPRIESLLAAKANVLVVAPKVTPNVHQWAKEKKLVWEERPVVNGWQQFHGDNFYMQAITFNGFLFVWSLQPDIHQRLKFNVLIS